MDDSGQAVNISAGHCNPAEGQPSPVFLPNHQNVDDSQQIGAFSKSSVGNPADKLDYSVIKLNEAGVKAGLDRPAVRGANGTTLEITGTARPVVGAPICKSGQTSSFTCGVVAADHVETQLFVADGSSRVVNGFAGTACTLRVTAAAPSSPEPSRWVSPVVPTPVAPPPTARRRTWCWHRRVAPPAWASRSRTSWTRSDPGCACAPSPTSSPPLHPVPGVRCSRTPGTGCIQGWCPLCPAAPSTESVTGGNRRGEPI